MATELAIHLADNQNDKNKQQPDSDKILFASMINRSTWKRAQN